jgi:hypothetical protein
MIPSSIEKIELESDTTDSDEDISEAYLSFPGNRGKKSKSNFVKIINKTPYFSRTSQQIS